MGKYKEEDIRNELASLTQEDKDYSRDWVKNLGGTIEFGQLISDRPSEVALGAEEERVELQFDYTIGKSALYEQSLDEAVRNLAFKLCDSKGRTVDESESSEDESESSSVADEEEQSKRCEIGSDEESE